MFTSTTLSRIESIAPRLHHIALQQAQRSQIDAEDLEQDIYVELFTKVAKNPDLCNQTDAYIANAGYYAAAHNASKDRTRINHDYTTREIVDDEGEPTSIFDMLPLPQPGVEDDVVETETLAGIAEFVRELSVDDLKITRMAYAGSTNTEIAKAYGVSSSAITQRRQKIAARARLFLEARHV